MNDKKLKHLEFIQNVITRMSSNSFVVKDWSVTLVAAIFALAAKDSKSIFAIVTFLPIFTFWVLASLFLFQERRYRELYKLVAARDEAQIDFAMDASHLNSGTFVSAAFAPSIFSFHGTLIAISGLIMAISIVSGR